MNRRSVLKAGAGVAGLLGTSGCLGSSGGGSGGDLPDDPDPSDGYPPAFEETPTERSIDPGSFATTRQDGVDVPLAPIDAVYNWYRRRAARFVDARGETQYRRSHVYGAVLSPAPSGLESDPVADWPKDDRIVCYCGCPHHLSSIRAANLIANGFENVYVIDEGFWEWHDRGYPMAGDEVSSQPAAYIVSGLTDPAFAGETAWAAHEPTGQREAAAIGPDGTFELELRFADVSPASVVRVWTPEYAVRSSLADLTADVVTAPGNGAD